MNRNDFELYLEKKVNEYIPSRTKQAMAYSLMNGGKRIRPQLLFALLNGYGMDAKIGYPVACGIEMIHTYSLIHDDLPAMDNDALRRGKPTCHIAFDEATAILAGDGLLTKAFEVALECPCSDTQKVKIIQNMASYSGVDGMIYGQDLDLQAENEQNPTWKQLMDIDEYKTAKLLTLPLVCGTIIANHEEDIPALKKIGLNIGIQFQMIDDILDITQSEETLGKSTSDTENQKLTAVRLLGLEKAQEMVQAYDRELRDLLHGLHCDTKELEDILNFLIKRTF